MQRFCKSLTFALLLAVLTSTSSFGTTITVGDTGVPATNGTNLLNTLAGLTPSPTQLYLVRLDAGIFDLGGATLNVPSYVDIEGSGRDVTYITSTSVFVPLNYTLASVAAGVESEVRNLTLRNTTPGNGTGISIASDEFLLTLVNVEVEAGATGVGVATSGSSPRIDKVFVRMDSGGDDTGISVTGGGTVINETFVFAASFGSDNVGVFIDDGSVAFLDRVVSFALLGDTNYGVYIARQSSPELYNVRSLASGGTDTRGLYLFKEAVAEVKESSFTATGNTQVIAASLEDGRLLTTESTYRASGLAVDPFAVYAARLTGASNLASNQSNWDGSSFAVSNSGSGVANFGASQLIGQATSTAINGLRCIFAYRGNYTARNAACQ